MNFKKILSVLMITSAMFLLAACNDSKQEDNSKAPQEESAKKENQESSVENPKSKPKITSVTLNYKNDREIYIVPTAEGENLIYAFYVIKDREIYETFKYQKEAHFSYELKEPGSYKVRAFVKDKDGNKVTKDTETIEFPY